jgi:hypothetical protein
MICSVNANEVMQMIAELAESQKDTDRQIKETDRQIKETDRQVKETAQQMKETDRQMKETDRQMKETDRKLRETNKLFNDHWGKLVEALMASGLVELFRARGMVVSDAGRDVELFAADGHKVAQIDVLVRNGDEDVAVEVKTTCRPKDIDEHIERLGKVHAVKEDYQKGRKKLYGAVAALSFVADADLYAERKGFFVLKCGEGIATIRNKPDFKPKTY